MLVKLLFYSDCLNRDLVQSKNSTKGSLFWTIGRFLLLIQSLIPDNYYNRELYTHPCFTHQTIVTTVNNICESLAVPHFLTPKSGIIRAF